MAPTVYLSGAMDLVSESYARAWRDQAKELIREHTQLEPVDPMDYENDSADDAEIVNRDRTLVMRSRVVLVDGRQPGWGTAMEVLIAHRQAVPVIVWGVTRAQAPKWLRFHATTFALSLADAVFEAAALA